MDLRGAQVTCFQVYKNQLLTVCDLRGGAGFGRENAPHRQCQGARDGALNSGVAAAATNDPTDQSTRDAESLRDMRGTLSADPQLRGNQFGVHSAIC
jgi:hypothetical protein